MRWVEYTNYGGRSHYADLRRAARAAGAVRGALWGLGNEVYGRWQMGHRPAAQYAADAREHALYMRAVDPGLRLVAVGSGPGERRRTRKAGRARCCARRARWWTTSPSISTAPATTSARPPGERTSTETTVDQSLYFEQQLRGYADLVAREARRAGVDRPLALALDEWNIRHLEPASWPVPQPGADGGVAPRELPALEGRAPGRTRVNRWSPRRRQTPSSTPGCCRPCSASRAARAGGDGQHGQPDQRQRPAGGAPGWDREERHLPRLGPLAEPHRTHRPPHRRQRAGGPARGAPGDGHGRLR